MLDGVIITPLRQLFDERGKVMHMLRRDSAVFLDFGEVYFSCLYPGAVKGWNQHKLMTLNFAVPHGLVKLVLYDARDNSATRGKLQEIYLGPENYFLVTIPPMIWTGCKGIGTEVSIVANCASLMHDPQEVERLAPDDPAIPYDWSTRPL